MNFLPLIEAKRDGHELTAASIHELIAAYTAESIPDYQMAAFLMAVYFRGLSTAETASLTMAMRTSGRVLSFPEDPRPVVDKHSTGGVGDKISLPLAPLLACLGFRVPMISGRGLGITGGTLDKLETIPGYNALPSVERIIEQVQEIGCVICGQTEEMVPADKRIYALRDATGTVPSTHLITASILSKKLAEGLDALVLDVKFGAAASISDEASSLKLARAMVALGAECGVNTRALWTDMGTPIGRAVGNFVEVRESVDCLDGNGPDDLRELTLACAASLLVQTGTVASDADGVQMAAKCLDSGAPRRKWDEMLIGQGADLSAFNARLARDHSAPSTTELKADRSGFVSACDARIVGEIVRDLGGGRLAKDSAIHPDVGIDRLAKPGEEVRAGDVIARIHSVSAREAGSARERLRTAFAISDAPPVRRPLVREIIDA
ncbi:MAG TPA: thymidine phosphorylase [Armatimonadota bacterium]|jgi:pyrimidine-nucleoside phosphorylase